MVTSLQSLLLSMVLNRVNKVLKFNQFNGSVKVKCNRRPHSVTSSLKLEKSYGLGCG